MSLASRPDRRETQRHVIERMRSHQLFRRMVSRQGIDLTARWSRELEDMIFRAMGGCTSCATAQACRRWLDADRPLASYVAFCPNAELIETCRLLDPAAPPPGAGPGQTSIFDEPSLAEVMADPIIKLVVTADYRSADGAERPA